VDLGGGNGSVRVERGWGEEWWREGEARASGATAAFTGHLAGTIHGGDHVGDQGRVLVLLAQILGGGEERGGVEKEWQGWGLI
jgi:hypothetical protein